MTGRARDEQVARDLAEFVETAADIVARGRAAFLPELARRLGL